MKEGQCLGRRFIADYHFKFLVEDGMSVKKLCIYFGILDKIANPNY